MKVLFQSHSSLKSFSICRIKLYFLKSFRLTSPKLVNGNSDHCAWFLTTTKKSYYPWIEAISIPMTASSPCTWSIGCYPESEQDKNPYEQQALLLIGAFSFHYTTSARWQTPLSVRADIFSQRIIFCCLLRFSRQKLRPDFITFCLVIGNISIGSSAIQSPAIK